MTTGGCSAFDVQIGYSRHSHSHTSKGLLKCTECGGLFMALFARPVFRFGRTSSVWFRRQNGRGNLSPNQDLTQGRGNGRDKIDRTTPVATTVITTQHNEGIHNTTSLQRRRHMAPTQPQRSTTTASMMTLILPPVTRSPRR